MHGCSEQAQQRLRNVSVISFSGFGWIFSVTGKIDCCWLLLTVLGSDKALYLSWSGCWVSDAPSESVPSRDRCFVFWLYCIWTFEHAETGKSECCQAITVLRSFVPPQILMLRFWRSEPWQISVCVFMALYLNLVASLTVCVVCVICASFYTSVLLVWHLVVELLLNVWVLGVVVQDLNLWALSMVSVRWVIGSSFYVGVLLVWHLVVQLLLSVWVLVFVVLYLNLWAWLTLSMSFMIHSMRHCCSCDI